MHSYCSIIVFRSAESLYTHIRYITNEFLLFHSQGRSFSRNPNDPEEAAESMTAHDRNFGRSEVTANGDVRLNMFGLDQNAFSPT